MPLCGSEKLWPPRGSDSEAGSASSSVHSTSPPSQFSPLSTPPRSPTVRRRPLHPSLSAGHISVQSVRQRLAHLGRPRRPRRPPPRARLARPAVPAAAAGPHALAAVHLARNFHSAGARVVVCEVEGLFGLARFSAAVERFHRVPRPDAARPERYVQALCALAERERAALYVPVSAATPAHFDALAKPHLELLGCAVFCPSVREVALLDDALQALGLCAAAGLPTPAHHAVTSRDDLARLYASGAFRTGRHVLTSCRERLEVALPNQRGDLRLPHEPSAERPWVALHDAPGRHFLTCTTVKDAQVVANVTCRVEPGAGGLVPVEHAAVSAWLRTFFGKTRELRHVTGHVSFRFVEPAADVVLPLGVRVGVSMPCICYTSVHPRIVWRPCRHFSRQNSGPLVADAGRYWMHEAVLSTLRHPSVEAVSRLIGTVLDKREALFALWDPLPYLAYYHLQLPFRNVLALVQARNGLQYRTMAAPVH
ncbi:hypothetical protein ANN_05665 [Periplaneta americana]|uniref:Uncharacterized protein n=1 Tax=Periplaneta americana TaxID=6978 RepID=A0ABQ8TBF7_PERAM|nr:hypothetical protein ANN_05665 [Periplaneta americana]